MHVILKKIDMFLDYRGAPLFYVHSAFCVDDVKRLHSGADAYFYSLWHFTETTPYTQLRKLNTDTIPHCVAFDGNFQSKGNKRSNARLS